MTVAQIENIETTLEESADHAKGGTPDEAIRELSSLELALVGGGLGNMLLQ
jgi:hypothetical protein